MGSGKGDEHYKSPAGQMAEMLSMNTLKAKTLSMNRAEMPFTKRMRLLITRILHLRIKSYHRQSCRGIFTS